jgi:hypothetical protein
LSGALEPTWHVVTATIEHSGETLGSWEVETLTPEGARARIRRWLRQEGFEGTASSPAFPAILVTSLPMATANVGPIDFDDPAQT